MSGMPFSVQNPLQQLLLACNEDYPILPPTTSHDLLTDFLRSSLSTFKASKTQEHVRIQMGKVTELQKIKTHENILQERSPKPLKTFKNTLSTANQRLLTYCTPNFVTLLVVIHLQILIGIRYGTKTFLGCKRTSKCRWEKSETSGKCIQNIFINPKRQT